MKESIIGANHYKRRGLKEIRIYVPESAYKRIGKIAKRERRSRQVVGVAVFMVGLKKYD